MVVFLFHHVVVCFVDGMYPVSVLNAAFCVVRSLLMFVENTTSGHMNDIY